MGGDTIPVEVGSIIAEGRSVVTARGAESAGAETCVFDDRIGVGADVPDGAQPLEIVWTVRPDCSVVVTSVAPTQAAAASDRLPSGPPGPMIPEVHAVAVPDVNPNYTLYGGTSQNAYLGWVKGIVQEQFGITSTERYTEFRWLQSPAGVQRPHANDGYCYHSAFPGIWRISNCNYITHDMAPGLVWKEAWGDYEYYPCYPCQGIGWRHYVVFDGYVGGWAYDCFLYGSLPPAWDHRCRGGRDRLQ